MGGENFTRLERLTRSMAGSHWKKLAMMRSCARAPWLDAEVERLYAATTPASLADLSEEECERWLNTLTSMEGQLRKVEQEIPFERKLRPMMRPFRQRFQAIIRLRNAVLCGIAGLRQRLAHESMAPLEGLPLSPDEIARARDVIATAVPGWNNQELDLYGQL